ncbi:MAG: 4Fe-4S dicluster domain-containing protein [Bacteroidota bacterium]
MAKAPWTAVKIRKKALKHAIFLVISAVIAHTFLAYIIGTDALIDTVSQSPFSAPGGFLAIVAFIGIFYFVFARMREQVCIAICPYGRLQGVLLDDTSINVIYDYVRGEPRGKLNKGRKKKSSCTDCEDCRTGKSACADRILAHMESALTTMAPPKPPKPKPVEKGDCIACNLCVQVCPTGIDIRNGIQMECVNCTACIDACDTVMDKIDKPRGLIRFDSESGVARGERKVWTPRVFAYSGVLLALIALNIFLLGSRDGLDVILLRTPGLLYQENQDGSINNLYTYQIVNKTGKDLPLEFRVVDFAGNVRPVGEAPTAEVGEVTEGALFIDLPTRFNTKFNGSIEVEVWSGDEHLETISTTFIHPQKQ